LGESGELKAIEPLVRLLTANSTGHHQELAAHQAVSKALLRLCPQSVDYLIKVLGEGGSDLKEAAARELGHLGDLRAVEPLTKALEDLNAKVRRAAAMALGELRDARAFDAIVKRLADEDADVSREGAWALLELADRHAVEPLIAVLGIRGDNKLWQAAAELLAQSDDPRAIEPLTVKLQHQDWDVRKTAAKALICLLAGPASKAVTPSQWKNIRKTITAYHHDHTEHQSSDCGPHTDRGIGLEFPRKPPVDGTARREF